MTVLSFLRCVALLTAGLVASLSAETFTPFPADGVPQTAIELWGKEDLRSEPLDVEVVKEWDEDGVVCRIVRYTVCTVKGTPSRIAAFYTFPKGAVKAPAFVWAHGGGQRADRKRGTYFAKNGYATIDINWGGREMVEGIKINTDWGKVDPSQGPQFYPGALRPQVKLDLKPDEHTIDAVPSPRNGNWFLLTYAARRAITFLEQQPEVDPEKIGMTGYSMGGNITSYGSIDPRLKAVVPMVGGTGFLTTEMPGVPGSATRAHFANADLYGRTVDSSSFWPHAKCPVLFLSATNDFHGLLDRAYDCIDLLPEGTDWRASFTPHFNHGLAPAQWVTLDRWFDHYLKGTGKPLPVTPPSTFRTNPDGTVTFTVRPENRDQVESVEVFYTTDPAPITRFWKTAPSSEEDGTWTAHAPLQPGQLFKIYAHCTYRLPEGKVVQTMEGSTSTFGLASRLHTHRPSSFAPDQLRAKATPQEVFHDFTSEGASGWGSPSGRGGLRTYKPRDPSRAAHTPETAMVIQLGETTEPFSLRLRVSQNEFLRNGKPKQTFVWSKNVTPAKTGQEIRILPSDFKVQGGEGPLENWENLVHLTIHSLGVKDGRHVDLTRDQIGAIIQKITWAKP